MTSAPLHGAMEALLATLVDTQVEAALSAAVVKFHNGSLSPQDATNTIAQIAALRSLCRTLDQRLKAVNQ